MIDRLINIWTYERENYVNGPGRRFVIWTQGCHLACPQCWNKHTWSFAKNRLISADALFGEIAAAPALSGITFTGGEPFLQAKNLTPLARRVKEELGLTIQIFTGFELAELQKRPQKELLSLADIIVAGRFNPARPNNNQKVYELSGVKWAYNNTDVEIDIDARGNLLLTGYPSDTLIQNIEKAVR